MSNIWAQEQINRLRAQYPEGTRIQVDSMENDPRPIPSGTKGTVLYVDDIGTIHCKFDNGRGLGLIPDEDKFHVIAQEMEEPMEQEEETMTIGGI